MSSALDELASLLAATGRAWRVEAGEDGRSLESVQAEAVFRHLGTAGYPGTDEVSVSRGALAVLLQYSNHALRTGGFGRGADGNLMEAIGNLNQRMMQ
jgi:hypothetical protein